MPDIFGLQIDAAVCGLQLSAEPSHSRSVFRLPKTFVCSPSLTQNFIEYHSRKLSIPALCSGLPVFAFIPEVQLYIAEPFLIFVSASRHEPAQSLTVLLLATTVTVSVLTASQDTASHNAQHL